MERIRALSDDCAVLRPSDLDGIPDDDIHKFVSSMPINTKLAQHGKGQTWTPVGPDFNPYKTSPLVNSTPEFGHETSGNPPGGGNADSKDPEKSNGSPDEDEKQKDLKKERIDELLKSTKGEQYIIKKTLLETEEPTEEIAKQLFGPNGVTDGKIVYVIVRGFENAMAIQQKVPGSSIEHNIEPKEQ